MGLLHLTLGRRIAREVHGATSSYTRLEEGLRVHGATNRAGTCILRYMYMYK